MYETLDDSNCALFPYPRSVESISGRSTPHTYDMPPDSRPQFGTLMSNRLNASSGYDLNSSMITSIMMFEILRGI